MNNKKIIVIDCNNICHIAWHSLPDLSDNEKPTAVIFGFLNALLRIQTKLDGDNWVFCWDSRKSYRKKIFPEYKAKRYKDKTDEELRDLKIAHNQFTEIRKEILPDLGFKNIFMKIGFEADDLIASVVSDYRYNNNKFIIVSTDQDLYQLFNSRVSIFNPKTKKILTEKWFNEKYEIEPFRWAMVKAIGGCSSDNIPGIKGVGEKSALKFHRNKLNKKSKFFKKIISKDGCKTNAFFKKLTILPFIKAGKLININIENQKLSKKKFINLFEKYRMYSLLKDDSLKKWTKNFNLT